MNSLLCFIYVLRGLTESDIDERISGERAELRKKLDEGHDISERVSDSKDSHAESIRKEDRNGRLASALGLNRSRSRSRSYSPRKRRSDSSRNS